MRIVFNMEFTDRCGLFEAPDSGEDSEELIFESFDEARACWNAAVGDWVDGDTGWFVFSIEAVDDEGKAHFLYVDEFFPDAEFDTIIDWLMQ